MLLGKGRERDLQGRVPVKLEVFDAQVHFARFRQIELREVFGGRMPGPVVDEEVLVEPNTDAVVADGLEFVLARA